MSKSEDSGARVCSPPKKSATKFGEEGDCKVNSSKSRSKTRKRKVDKRLVRTTNYLLSARQVKRLVDEGDLRCPNCGGTDIIWACCKLSVFDSKILEKFSKEVRKFG